MSQKTALTLGTSLRRRISAAIEMANGKDLTPVSKDNKVCGLVNADASLYCAAQTCIE
jgi:hypothetical protein